MKKLKIFFTAILLVIAVSFGYSQDKENYTGKCSHSSTMGIEKQCDHTGNTGGLTDTNKSTTTVGLICPVSKENIEPGKGVEFSYLGKTYTFCCQNCVKKFSSEPLDYIKDEVSCLIMGEPVSKENYAEFNSTKYYFCCQNCVKKFNKDPEKYLNKFKKEDK